MLPISGFDGDIGSVGLFIFMSLAVIIILMCIAFLIMEKLNFDELRKTSKKIRTITYIPFVLAAGLFGDCVYSSISSYNHEIQEARPEIVSQKYTLLEKLSDGIDIYNKVSNAPLRFYLEDNYGKQPEFKTIDVPAGKNANTNDLDSLKVSSLSAERDAFNGIKIEEENGNGGATWKVWNRSQKPVCITESKHKCDSPKFAHVIKPGKYGEF